MNEEAQQYFNDIKHAIKMSVFGFLTYIFVAILSAFTCLPASKILVLFSAVPLWSIYTICAIKVVADSSKKREYYRIKKQQNPANDDRLDELEEYFLNSRIEWKLLLPWKAYQFVGKVIFDELFYGESMAPGNIYFFRMDLLRQTLFKICNFVKADEKQKINFSSLPYAFQSRFLELQIPYMKYKLTHVLPNEVFENQALIVDNLELHFGTHPTFYSKWFYLRYLNRRSSIKNLIIDMPWHSINDVFKYFSTPFYDNFVLTYTTKINQNEKYPNFLPKIIPSNSILLSSLPLNSLHSALKHCNVFSIKKLEIIESRLSENDLKLLKTLKMQSLLLNLSLCENYGEIDSILEAVHGISHIHIDITLSFYLKGYFEPCVVKWVGKYGYPKNFVFILRILDQFHIKFL